MSPVDQHNIEEARNRIVGVLQQLWNGTLPAGNPERVLIDELKGVLGLIGGHWIPSTPAGTAGSKGNAMPNPKMVHFKIRPQLGGPAPDGFEVDFDGPGVGKVYRGGAIIMSVTFDPDSFREFWAEAGRLLREFDERGGEPSS